MHHSSSFLWILKRSKSKLLVPFISRTEMFFSWGAADVTQPLLLPPTQRLTSLQGPLAPPASPDFGQGSMYVCPQKQSFSTFGT